MHAITIVITIDIYIYIYIYIICYTNHSDLIVLVIYARISCLNKLMVIHRLIDWFSSSAIRMSPLNCTNLLIFFLLLTDDIFQTSDYCNAFSKNFNLYFLLTNIIEISVRLKNCKKKKLPEFYMWTHHVIITWIINDTIIIIIISASTLQWSM